MPIDFDRLVAQTTAALGPPVGTLPRLNLGCGRDHRPGWVNLDHVPIAGVDVAASVGSTPLPFRENTFGVVLCRDILEHVDVVAALREVHRVLASGGAVILSTVHFTSRNLYVDPTHIRGFSVRTLDFFTKSDTATWHRPYYFDFAFDRIDYAGIQFGSTLGKGRYLVWDRAVEPCVNASRTAQDLYEMTLASRLFPAANVVAVLRK